jgi:hypothetical protein
MLQLLLVAFLWTLHIAMFSANRTLAYVSRAGLRLSLLRTQLSRHLLPKDGSRSESWNAVFFTDRHLRRRSSSGRFCASTVTCPREPVSFSRLLRALSPLRTSDWYKWSAWTAATEFWTVLRIYCHVPSSAIPIKSLAVRCLVCICTPPAVVPAGQ